MPLKIGVHILARVLSKAGGISFGTSTFRVKSNLTILPANGSLPRRNVRIKTSCHVLFETFMDRCFHGHVDSAHALLQNLESKAIWTVCIT